MRLIEELWAEDPPDSARAQIQNPVSGLRKALGPAGALLRTQPPGYLLAVPENGLDESAFRTDLSDGRALWEAGDEAGAQSSSRRAVDRCRGPAYDGVDVPSVRAAAAELDELRIGALEDWAQSALAAADAADVAAELARELVTHPLRERLRALADAGAGPDRAPRRRTPGVRRGARADRLGTRCAAGSAAAEPAPGAAARGPGASRPSHARGPGDAASGTG